MKPFRNNSKPCKILQKQYFFSYSVKAMPGKMKKKKRQKLKRLSIRRQDIQTRHVELHGKTLGKRDCNILITPGYVEVSG